MTAIAILHPHGGMGDLILSYPVIAAFSKAYPKAEIIYVTPPGMEDVIRVNPRVHEVIALKADFASAMELSKHLKEKKVEIACALWSTFRVALLLKLGSIPVRIGQDGRLFYSHWFTHRVPVRSAKGDTKSHWVECLLDYPRAIGLNAEDKSIHIDAMPPETLEASRPYIVIHPGKGENVLERGWPVGYFAEVADRLKRAGYRIVFTGSGKEIKLVESITAKMKEQAISMAGKTDFRRLAGLLKGASCVICPDSGPMHLAAAAGTPVVALFAMKSDFPDRWAPWDIPQKIVRPETFPCKPSCAKETCRNFLCFQSLSVDETEAAAADLLKSAVKS